MSGNQIGVELVNYNGGSTASSQGVNNTFYNNNLIGNSVNALVEHATQASLGKGTDIVSWDNGAVGNYWSDYLAKYPNAKEIDSSGIGNTPYTIDENNTDHYPLLHQVNIPSISPTPEPSFSVGIWIPPVTIPIFVTALVVETVIVSSLLFRRHRKTANCTGMWKK